MTGQWINEAGDTGIYPVTWKLCGGTANSDLTATDGYYVVATQYFTTTLAGNADSKVLSCVQYID